MSLDVPYIYFLMAYRPRPTFNNHFETYLKGKAHFYGGSVEEVCKLIREAVKEKMQRESNGSVEMWQQYWNKLSEKEKNLFEHIV